jgi:hypothetical protein
MGSRWYDPGTGGFTTRDVMALDPRQVDDANRYTYAASSPLVHTDPNGICTYLKVCAGPGGRLDVPSMRGVGSWARARKRGGWRGALGELGRTAERVTESWDAKFDARFSADFSNLDPHSLADLRDGAAYTAAAGTARRRAARERTDRRRSSHRHRIHRRPRGTRLGRAALGLARRPHTRPCRHDGERHPDPPHLLPRPGARQPTHPRLGRRRTVAHTSSHDRQPPKPHRTPGRPMSVDRTTAVAWSARRTGRSPG